MTDLPPNLAANLYTLLLVAFAIGLSSSGHCLMMCGGISSALSSRLATLSPHRRAGRLLLFHIGRILCYATLGLALGSIIHPILQISPILVIVARVLAALLIILVGLYVAGFSQLVRLLETRLAFIWRSLQPLAQRWMPMHNATQALALGFLWGFLPCGMIYSTLLWASSQNQGWQTALLMAAFGLGTIPSLFLANWFSLQTLSILQRHQFRKLAGSLLVIFGLWSLAFLAMPHTSHQHSPETGRTSAGQDMPPATDHHSHHHH